MKTKCVIIGSGFAGMAAAIHLAHHNCEVLVLEKNEGPGGRARQLKAKGFTFDMGPSWYWMPDVFERFFNSYEKKVSDYYHLKRLTPSYKVYFKDQEEWSISPEVDTLLQEFEKIETGSAVKLISFLKDAEVKYKIGMQDMVYTPGNSPGEFITREVLLNLFKLNLFSSISSHIRKSFKNQKLIQLLEFPILFLGEKPQNIPALYSLMNYADIVKGTWYPEGGMYSVVDALYQLALEKGVTFRFNTSVESIQITEGKVQSIQAKNQSIATYQSIACDYLLAAADYHHVEQKLLPVSFRSYSEKYWDKRKLAPSSLIFYLGINKKLDGLEHHNLFFDENFEDHAVEIYDKPEWPAKPLFYLCMPSKTDSTVAPEGCENLFILIPVASGLIDTQIVREKYFDIIIDRIEKRIKSTIKEHIVYKQSYAHKDFIADYNSYKGNAYGLANTLLQTAFLRPKIKSKKIMNLFYAGQLTVPGPGVPPSLISGQLAANELLKEIHSFS